jgi:hypothetical protein
LTEVYLSTFNKNLKKLKIKALKIKIKKKLKKIKKIGGVHEPPTARLAWVDSATPDRVTFFSLFLVDLTHFLDDKNFSTFFIFLYFFEVLSLIRAHTFAEI